MLTAVLSDVHANLEALEATLADVERYRPQELIILGDAVGYGPQPMECLDLLARHARAMVLGNHDSAVIGRTDTRHFNIFARSGVRFSRAVLDAAHLAMLEALPLSYRGAGYLAVHATPFEPEAWHYLYAVRQAARNFQAFTEEICFVGHSHQPLAIVIDAEGLITALAANETDLESGKRYLINAGSVGQPRDGDPRSCWVLYDREAGHLSFHRVSYDISSVQAKMKTHGLPDFLIRRLTLGE